MHLPGSVRGSVSIGRMASVLVVLLAALLALASVLVSLQLMLMVVRGSD